VVGEIDDQLVHAPERGAVVQVAAVALDVRQVGMHELLQVEGKRRARDVEHRGRGARSHALGTGADERAEHAQPGVLGLGGERGDGGFRI